MNLDILLFQVINNFAGSNPDIDAFFVFGATTLFFVMWLLFVVMLLVTYDVGDEQSVSARVAGWFTSPWHKFKQLPLMMTGVAVMSSLVSFAFAQFIGMVAFRERPFVVLENVNKIIEKSALDKSFPSDHTTLAFALAFSVWWYNKRWGTLFLVLAAFVGLSRIYSGVHFPLDVVTGALLAFVVSYTTKLIFERFS